ncbi:aldo/keto reductase [Noviherbaspirillum malthae]|uniref:aldo/keto reductase n=1 Tax=Noviherbaspirillum malthae TaxID=1260987 RepID=UPI00188F7918|nr:aldo/keto reductase [Noviherbaspirillum malthae]
MQSPRIKITCDGPEFSRVVLGLWRIADWNMSPAQRLSLVEQALDLGITTIDHADIYGDYEGERLLGEALALVPTLRERIEIVSKCGIRLISANRPAHRLKHYDTGREHVIASVENSLTALRVEYLDLLLIHRPDPLMDADEVAEAFTTLRRDGKVRHLGVSNFTPAQFELLASRMPLMTNQIELSVMQTDAMYDGTLDQCQRLRIAPMAWSALAGGRLFNEKGPRAERLRSVLTSIADRHGVSTATVAYAWILRHPSRPLVLTGSQRIEAMREAVAATGMALSREEWYSILTASTGTSVP